MVTVGWYLLGFHLMCLEGYSSCFVYPSLFVIAECNKFTLSERIFFLTSYYHLEGDYVEIFSHFENFFPNHPVPTRNYVYKLHLKFQRIGAVANASKSGRPCTSRTEKITQLVAEAFVEQHNRSVNRLSLRFEFSCRSLQRKMKDLKLRVCHPYLLQALHEEDYPQCVNFCEWYLIIKEADPDFSASILWSDEVIFKLNSHVNWWNCIYWSDENPHLILEELNMSGVMVWAGVRGLLLSKQCQCWNVLVLLKELRLALDEDPRYTGQDVIF